MSEIPERVTRYRIDNGGFLQEHSRGNLVEITSAVPAIREQVLADAKARIEDINIEHHVMPHRHDDYALFEVALNCALAALTQPQTEKCPQCGGDGKGPLTHHFGEPCPTCDGGGAATAAGVADALTLTPGEARNLVDAAMGDEHDPQLLDSTVKRIGDEADRQLAEPGPYAKAFRERFPVPEFPGIEKEES